MKHRARPTCAVDKTLRIIGSRWTTLVLHNIFEGKNRFGELERAMPGISPKTLAVRLKELEQEGIITKKVFAEIPLHVEYALTKRGKSFGDILDKMAEWGERN